jgi:hypothetical protein
MLRERYGIDTPSSTRFYHDIEEQATDLDPHLSEDLRMLRRVRNNADYDLNLRFRKDDAIRAIVLAKTLITWLVDKYR